MKQLAGAALLALLAATAACAQGQAAAGPASAPATTRTLTREQSIARHADRDSKFIDVDGVPVHYKDQGSGPVIVLVPGTFGDLGDWDGWAAALVPSYRVVRFDVPGLGLTGEVPSGNYSVDRVLGLIDGLTDRLGIERFAIAGISYGGLIAFRYAATRSDRVSALVLANSAGIETGARGSTASATSVAASEAAPVPARTASYNILTDPSVTSADVETFLRYLLADPSKITPALVQRKLDYMNTRHRAEESLAGRRLYERGDPERTLAHVRAPTLVLWGGSGRALTPKTADAFVAALKNACSAERIVYADAGHMMNIDKAEATVADAKAFFDRTLRAAAPPACRPSPRAAG